MEIKITPLQTQKQVLTPFLRQSIEVLMLPQADLTTAIEQELQENPLLEADEITLHQTFKMLKSLTPRTLNETHMSNDGDNEPEGIHVEDTPTLEDSLIKQLHLEVEDPGKRKIGEFIIGNLNEEGFFQMNTSEAADFLNTGLVDVEESLKVIQGLEPLGIAAQSLEECLLIQLRTKTHAITPIAARIVMEHFADLAHKKYAAIAKELNITVEEVKEAAQLIASLNPRPVNGYGTVSASMYVQPDIWVTQDVNGELKIELNRNAAPGLRINQTYYNYLENPNVNKEEKAFIKERLTNAINFMKSVQQRGETLLNIARYIVDKQKRFIDGTAASIIPMTMKEIAQHIERNESTISRAISHKYIDTPVGLFPLKFFFSQAVFSGMHEDVSVHAIKEEIQRLVDEENKQSPLSDQDIQEHFREKGLKLARRTINKYRHVLNIAPSYVRKTSKAL